MRNCTNSNKTHGISGNCLRRVALHLKILVIQMTRNEAAKIVELLTTVDGGCSTCVGAVFRKFNERFPGFSDVIDMQWAEHFSDSSWRVDENNY